MTSPTEAQWMDLVSRFLNSSQTVASHTMMIQIQQMYWYYLDFHGGQCSQQQFLTALIQRMQWPTDEMWDAYRHFIQTEQASIRCGAILWNEAGDKVLLVRGFHGSKWFFPVGKQLPYESMEHAARRELWEEVGFRPLNVSDSLRWKSYFFLIAHGVSERYPFRPRVRREVKSIRWVPISQLKYYLASNHHDIIVEVFAKESGFRHADVSSSPYPHQTPPQEHLPENLGT
jgi:8-oxo-dGTP pyrophosphatase MutT (NUDIX family)